MRTSVRPGPTTISLDHPVPDALAVAAGLRARLKTTFKSDLARSEFAILDAFTRDNRAADLVVIYFAGHDVQIAGRN
jgi:hypothetical protein